MLKLALTTFFLLLLTGIGQAQQLRVLAQASNRSLRGICAVNDHTIWVSGSEGSVGLSTDAGLSWRWIVVPQYEKTDFRDIEAFSDQEAVIMGITDPAVLLKTRDGGKTWAKVFEDSSKAIFLDAMDFSGDQGILLGDPVMQKPFLAQTRDRGDSWAIRQDKISPVIQPGEAFFASSGTNIKWLTNQQYVYVSGGEKSALYIGDSLHFPLLLSQGKQTTGANSIALNPENPNQAYVTGGDFSRDSLRYGNALRIQIRPFIQEKPRRAPSGYRSCVEYLDAKRMVCCGTSGVDISEDGGMNWTRISSTSFHVCRKAKSGSKIFLAGAHGIIAVLEW